jgi:hypothetical protein
MWSFAFVHINTCIIVHIGEQDICDGIHLRSVHDPPFLSVRSLPLDDHASLAGVKQCYNVRFFFFS